ncbi:hypothetical protein FH966_08395 [Lentibacillus cibarius]|uniref:Uncharacterized protein n=1 Tax=Lentibacillus cibarius TaxID=2583219 RepID=A0A549YIJ2_9BACI|nr:hypothetical protein [Lentibacillus cibarius]TRM11702.1 hypothetical protein FH966_08395 [Lentibacillus cibarius]
MFTAKALMFLPNPLMCDANPSMFHPNPLMCAANPSMFLPYPLMYRSWVRLDLVLLLSTVTEVYHFPTTKKQLAENRCKLFV